MLDKIQNKLIDKLEEIDLMSISNLFDCKIDEVGGILTDYFSKRDYFNGNIDLTGIRNLKSLDKIKRIDGNLTAVFCSLEDLGNLKVVKGTISMSQTSVTTTNKLIYCNKLHVSGQRFNEIKKLAEVRGDVELWGTSVETLNELKLIGGTLSLKNNHKLETLGLLREVMGDVIIDRCDNLSSLGTLNTIGGCLDVRFAKLASFGSLSKLSGFVIALKSTVKNLYESGLEIIDFRPLSTVFKGMPRAMHLKVPKIDNLNNFGMIVIDDTKDDLFIGL